MGAPSPFAFLLEDPPRPEAARGLSGRALDEHLLRLARHEAAKGVGRTRPNPPVGAVLSRGDRVLAVGHHARAGDRHAEVVAFDAAAERGVSVVGATLTVTLEPCSHHGRTRPCVDRVLASGVARVVVGAVDPNPQVFGRGIEKLRQAGVRVDVVDDTFCHSLIEPFARAIQTPPAPRPFVVWKVAATLDGATRPGPASPWITGPAARALVHRLRDRVDAILVGPGTVAADDPQLTTRGVEGGRDAARFVIDRHARTHASARVFDGATGGAVLLTQGDAPAHAAVGVDVVSAADDDGAFSLERALAVIQARGHHTVLVEAGVGLGGALLGRGLVDEVWWFQAPAFGAGGVGVDAAIAPGVRLAIGHRAGLEHDSLVVGRPAGGQGALSTAETRR